MTTSTEQIEHLVEDIRVRLVENRYDDPGLASDLLAYVMRELGKVAADPVLAMANVAIRHRESATAMAYIEDWCSDVLQAMQSRAVAGGWPAPPEYPYEHVLGPDDLDPGEG